MSNALETVNAMLADCFNADGMHIHNLDKYFAEDCVFHDAQPGLEGFTGYKTLLGMMEAATESVGGARQPLVVGQGDLVSIRWTHQLKHTGDLFGVPATGKVVTSKGHETYRVEGGRIVENWAIMDVAGLMGALTA